MISCFVERVDDASKREESTQTRLSMERRPTPTGCWCGLPCLSKLWYGCAVGMTGCRLFHIFMVLGKKDVMNIHVCGHRAGCSLEYSEWMS